MTIELKNVWHILNKVLTMINVILLGVVTGNVLAYKEIRDKRIPPVANILLLLVLGLGLFAAIYTLLRP